ncbi:DUF481 domain-containing protein [Algoriphagus sp. A40]|uniref:DUF481 domain-containing protein n=1 Tax=Algoriphagus sp. A40 TaxID=1945863 RepID=UPI0009C77DD7|nr:DUF481 domain-containing protein [Algoriphagus sp. A40]OOG70452.1 hypothetical protein B0E43_17745 [Algoriphagus sp. A40]
MFTMFELKFRFFLKSVLLGIGICLVMLSPLFAQQDTLFTKYGDVLVGKIDNVNAESVSLKVKYRKDAIEIKFSELIRIQSASRFVLNDVGNKNWRGALAVDTLHSGQIGIAGADSVVFFSSRRVFDVNEDKPRKFKDGLKVSLDFGINRIKADNSLSANLGINSAYRSRRWVFEADYSAFSNSVDTVLNYWRNGIFSASYVLSKEWFVTSKLNLYSSSEQSLKLRRNIFAGLGKIFIHRSDEILSVSAGIMSNSERYTTSETNFSSSESFLSAHYNGKIVERWESVLDASIFPGLSESGRVRTNLNLDIKYKFLNHFYLGLRYTLNTDNQPQVEAAQSDYVFAVKFGWSLKKY